MRSHVRLRPSASTAAHLKRRLMAESLSFRDRLRLRSRVVGERASRTEDYVFQKLVGAGEIAARLGFKRIQRVHDWLRAERSGFPKPVRRIGGVRGIHIWFWPDVEEWARPRYPDQLEAWRYSLGKEDGPAPGRPELGPSAELIDDINAGRVRTE